MRAMAWIAASAPEESVVRAAPAVARYYAAHLDDVPGSGASLTVLSVPRPLGNIVDLALGIDDEQRTAMLAEDLGIAWTQGVRAVDIPTFIAATQERSSRSLHDPLHLIEWQPDYAFEIQTRWARDAIRQDQRLAHFVARAAGEAVVPFESSPLGGVSLMELASRTGTSAAVGYLALRYDPLVLLYGATGIVVLGASRGVARALEEGLHQRLLRWITGEELPPPETENEDADDSADDE